MANREGIEMNMDAVTVQDCIEMMAYREMAAVIRDGRVDGFEPAGYRRGGAPEKDFH